MRSLGLKPDCVSCHAAIEELTGSQWQQALQILAHMQRQGMSPDISAYKVCMDLCQKCSQWREALKLLADMESHSLRPDEESFLLGLEACIRQPSTEAYNTLLMICRQYGNWVMAAVAIEGLKVANVTSYNLAMAACIPEAPHIAIDILDMMIKSSELAPDIITFNTALEAFGLMSPTYKPWQKALLLLAEMQEKHVDPDVNSYNMAIHTCNRGCQWQLALQLLHDMQEKDVQPDKSTYLAARNACEKGCKWRHAYILDLKTRGLPCQWDCICKLCKPSL